MEIWFDFASTYSYPAVMRVEWLALEAGVALVWRPFLLGPIFGAQGWRDSPFNIYPTKGTYMWRDMERICQKENIPFQKPAHFPQNSVLPARVACCFQNEVWLPEFVRQVYLANFGYGRVISERECIAQILDQMNLDGVRLIDEALTPENKPKLRAQTELALEKGVFGAPTFVIGSELFWGNDRLEDAIVWAVSH